MGKASPKGQKREGIIRIKKESNANLGIKTNKAAT